MGVASEEGLWRVRGLRAYLAASGFARTADEMVPLTVVLLALERTGSTTLAGAAVAAYTLPSAVSGPVLGAWFDRTRHQRIALLVNGLLLAAVCLGLLSALGRATTPAVVLLAACAGVAVPMTSGGYSSILPVLVPPELRSRASALDAAVFNAATIVAPGLTGAFAATVGADTAMTAVAVFAGLGAVCTALLPATGASQAQTPNSSLFADVLIGLRHLARTAPLRGGTVTTVLSYGSVGALAIALPAHTERLGVGAESAGYLWTSIEVGCLVATLVIGRRLHRWRPERVVFLCVALYGLFMATWPAAGGLPALVALTLATGLAEGAVLPAIIAARSRYTPAELLARVSMTGASLKIGAFALGGLAGGWLVPTVGPSASILAVALSQVLASGLGLLASRPGRRRPPGDSAVSRPAARRSSRTRPAAS